MSGNLLSRWQGYAPAAAVGMIFLPPLAQLLGQASPPAIGWAIAAVAPGVLLMVDSVDKAVRRRHYGP